MEEWVGGLYWVADKRVHYSPMIDSSTFAELIIKSSHPSYFNISFVIKFGFH